MNFEIPNTSGENKHQKLIEYFKGLSPFDTGYVEHFREVGDIGEVEKLEQKKEEFDAIVTSLEAGDKEPARSKLMSMIEKNVGGFKIFDKLTPEVRVNSILGLQELIEQLVELEKDNQ